MRHSETVLHRPAGRPGPVLNLKAPLALTAGAVALLIPLVGLVAIALGVTAVRELRAHGGRGLGQAVAGIALGALGLLLLGLVLVGVIDRPG